jgi:hypothetical protein
MQILILFLRSGGKTDKEKEGILEGAAAFACAKRVQSRNRVWRVTGTICKHATAACRGAEGSKLHPRDDLPWERARKRSSIPFRNWSHTHFTCERIDEYNHWIPIK